MRQFVPLTDEMLYQMGGLPGPLVPYRAGLECWHALCDGAGSAATQKAEVAITDNVCDESKAARVAVTAPGSYTSAASACR